MATMKDPLIRQRTLTCDEAWMCNQVCWVLCIVTQVSNLHVAIVHAEDKGQGE